MGILKTIKDLLVETGPKEINEPDRQITPPPVITFIPTSINTDIDASLILEFTERFRKILKDENERNFPGNDYFEFNVMRNAMSSIPDERLKYTAAFAGWSVSGNVNKESLLSTANKYLSLVEKEISDFESAYNSNYNSIVGKNNTDIELKQKEIDQMKERITLLNKEVENLKSTNIEATQSLISKKNAFTKVGEDQKNEILNEIQNIKTYI